MTVVATDADGAAAAEGGGEAGETGARSRSEGEGVETGGGTVGDGCGAGGGSGLPKKAKGYLPERKKRSISPSPGFR